MLRIKTAQEISSCVVDCPPTITGFDYKNQAWIVNGVYQRCGHPESMDCDCYGRTHEGEPLAIDANIH